MSPEPLLLIGASVRAVAESAAAAGFEVGAIDLFGDADLCRTAQTVRLSDRFPIDALRLAGDFPPGPWLYTGGLENHPRLVARLAAQRPLLGNGAEVLRRVRDPRQLAVFAERSGLNIAAPSILAGGATGRGPSADAGSWLVKQRRSSGGLSVRPANSADFADPRSSNAPGRYLQRLIAGAPYGASYLAACGKACFLGLAEQLSAPAVDGSAPYRYGGSITTSISADDQRLLEEFGARLADEFALRGLFGIDLIRDAGGRWYLLEVNPRPTASMDLWESSAAPSLIARHVAACRLGKLPSPMPPALDAPLRARKVVYSGALRGRVPQELTEALLRGSGECGQRTVADVPAAGALVEPDQPLVTLYATGSSRAGLELALADAQHNVLRLFAELLVELPNVSIL